MYLYEAHVPVRDTEASRKFYLDVVGLEFAYRSPDRDIVFLWIEPNKRSMLGLWGPSTVYGTHHNKHHLAFAVSLPEVLAAGERLEALGVPPRNFFGEQTTEPTVIGWMPSAQIYFSDPDGHALEFIALLEDEPDADFHGSFSAWQRRKEGGPGGR